MNKKPESPADRRPDDEPFYIVGVCDDCGSDLVYYQEVYPGTYEEWEDPWFDEFVCPDCRDGVYMDWPDFYREEVEDRADFIFV